MGRVCEAMGMWDTALGLAEGWGKDHSSGPGTPSAPQYPLPGEKPECDLFPVESLAAVHELRGAGRDPMNAHSHPDYRASLCLGICLQFDSG